MSQRTAAFAQRLQKLRKATGLTQEVLARRCGMSRQTLAKLESGEREPTWNAVCRLARALPVGVEAFAANGSRAANPQGNGLPSGQTMVALRQRQARAIRNALLNLSGQERAGPRAGDIQDS
jgi:putative transcriptional regulator